MLTHYFSDPVMLDLIQQTPAAAYLDCLSAELVATGYKRTTIQRYLRAAAHASYWQHRRGRSLTEFGSVCIEEFKRHLPGCQCKEFRRVNDYDVRGARKFLQYLQQTAVVAAEHRPDPITRQPPLFVEFCDWMRQHQGTHETTLETYRRTIVDALNTLGTAKHDFNAAALRTFVLDRAGRHGRCQAKVIITALRAFVRYLIATGWCQAGLDATIPSVAGWRLSALPRYLPTADVERTLSACDTTTVAGARDHAILLLLARLGLRAGDIYALRLGDLDWKQATVEVLGKSRRKTQLPLPQEVGDAVLHYLKVRPPVGSSHLFLRLASPVGPFAKNSTAVSDIVERALQRAGVGASNKGAHVLRHSAATSLLAEGASLESIAVLLRHRSLDTTAHYAKVDMKRLGMLAQPWPEVSPC
jgi:integrase/recombinase XerD